MAKRSLILYASRGGNTERVAERFKQVFEKYDWECDTLKVSRQTDWDNLPFTPKKDYDIICLGSLVISGIPDELIFHHSPVWELVRSGSGGGRRGISEGYGHTKGIAFVTYQGAMRGPAETLVAVDCLALRLDDMRIKCIGKLACCGGGHRLYRHDAPNIVEQKMHCTLDEASAMLYRYFENPNYPEFANLTEEEREMFEYERNFPRDKMWPPPPPGTRNWHYNEFGRPNERDLMKCEIFLEEIIEDYYADGIEAYPFSQYICIS